MKKISPEGCLTPALMFMIFLSIAVLLFSCAVSKPVVKEYKVKAIYEGFFSATRGKDVILFGTQKGDSVFVGKVINVSFGRK